MTVDRARLLGALDRLGVQGLGSVAVADVPELQVADPLYALVLDAAIDTNAATLELGLHTTTYQPDAFPGVVYADTPSVLVFGTGHVVVADATDRAAAEDAVAEVVARLLETGLVDPEGVPDEGVSPVDLPAVEGLPPAWREPVVDAPGTGDGEDADDEGSADADGTCADCDADLDGTENFCPSCGADLR